MDGRGQGTRCSHQKAPSLSSTLLPQFSKARWWSVVGGTVWLHFPCRYSKGKSTPPPSASIIKAGDRLPGSSTYQRDPQTDDSLLCWGQRRQGLSCSTLQGGLPASPPIASYISLQSSPQEPGHPARTGSTPCSYSGWVHIASPNLG
jgi:hypothetical protein